MNLTELPSAAGHPLKAASAPQYPAADDPAPAFGGFVFSGAEPPTAPGVFALTLSVDGLAYPIVVGEGEDLAHAIAEAAQNLPPLPGALGRLWMERGQPRQRVHIAHDLVRKLNPPLNVEGRTARAADAIAALAPDLAADAFPPEADRGAGTVSEEALRDLVRSFYGAARADPLLGPVLTHAVDDWEGHYETVQDFWSRALIGTTRYSGFPFTAHVPLNLGPEHFDRWLAIFRATAKQSLPSEAARRAILKVESMSKCFQAGLMPVAAPAGDS